MLKRKIKKTLTSMITIILAVVFSFSAFAVVINDITVVRLCNLPTKTVDGVKCTGVGGIGVSESNNCLFAVKNATSTDNVAKFYYYPNVSTMASVKRLNLFGAGHANAMTADADNVYITCWANKNVQEGNTYNNWIMQIPISVIENLSEGSTIPKKTSSTAGYTILTPKVLVNGSYVDYTKTIKTITLHKNKGTFIIGYSIEGKNDNNYSYTTAKIITHNGQKIFVVSTDPDDMFVIKNNLKYKEGTGQDVAYTPEHGFFKGVWYDEYSPKKSVILWADIDSATTDTITYNGVSYRLYIPDIIDINMVNAKYNGIKMYTKFEIESIAFTRAGTMLAGFNIENADDYIAAYKADNDGDSPPADGIFKIYNGTKGQFKPS